MKLNILTVAPILLVIALGVFIYTQVMMPEKAAVPNQTEVDRVISKKSSSQLESITYNLPADWTVADIKTSPTYDPHTIPAEGLKVFRSPNAEIKDIAQGMGGAMSPAIVNGAELHVLVTNIVSLPTLHDTSSPSAFAESSYAFYQDCGNCSKSELVTVGGVPAHFMTLKGGMNSARYSLINGESHYEIKLIYSHTEDFSMYKKELDDFVDSVRFIE